VSFVAAAAARLDSLIITTSIPHAVTMSSPIVSATMQSAFLGGLSNVLAQVIAAYRSNDAVEINWIPVFQFLLYSVLNTPINFLWQEFLESTFPAYPPPPRRKPGAKVPPPRFSVRNTLAKFALDQTVGATFNTLLFSTFMRSLLAASEHAPRVTSLSKAVAFWTTSGAVDFSRVDFPSVWRAAQDEFWDIVVAGWKLWPAVSLINFTLIKTVQGRNLVGSVAGVVWGIYMSLVAAA
jgi:hypothetical protein